MDEQEKQEHYRQLVAGGLSEAEAQEEVWPQNGGLEELGNTAPVDSSSPDYEGPEVTTEPEEDDADGVMLWKAGAETLLDTLKDWLRFASFATRHTVLTKRLIAAGAPPDAGKITVEIDALKAQALSVGLNFVGFFVPELGDEAEALLKEIAQKHREWEPSEEEQKAYNAAREAVMEEDEAAIYGFESVEEHREAKAQAQAAYEAEQAEAIDVQIAPETGAPHLN